MMTGELVGYFGFGSLVNKHTLRTSYVDIVPATLKGFRRHWQPRSRIFEQHVSLLSVHEDSASEIKGMIVLDLLENLPLVDEREEGYSRYTLSGDQLEVHCDVELPANLHVYIADQSGDEAGEGDLLQSYLDAVLQGFRNEYGDDGVKHFVDSTSGFERSMIKDRLSPIYPRSVELTSDEVAFFDAELRRAGVKNI